MKIRDLKCLEKLIQKVARSFSAYVSVFSRFVETGFFGWEGPNNRSAFLLDERDSSPTNHVRRTWNIESYWLAA